MEAVFGDPRLPVRFWTKVEPLPYQGDVEELKNTNCWQWLGTLAPHGYGQFRWNEGTRIAHRVAYLELGGNIPEGLEIDHRCRNRACVNPMHLQVVTRSDNLKTAVRPHTYKKWTLKNRKGTSEKCGAGHLRVPGKRACQECQRESNRLRDARLREAKRQRGLRTKPKQKVTI